MHQENGARSTAEDQYSQLDEGVVLLMDSFWISTTKPFFVGWLRRKFFWRSCPCGSNLEKKMAFKLWVWLKLSCQACGWAGFGANVELVLQSLLTWVTNYTSNCGISLCWNRPEAQDQNPSPSEQFPCKLTGDIMNWRPFEVTSTPWTALNSTQVTN